METEFYRVLIRFVSKLLVFGVTGLAATWINCAFASSPPLVFSLQVSSTKPLTFTGHTNLPDGTMVQLILRGDIPGCFPHCGFTDDAVVKAGKFELVPTQSDWDGTLPDDGYTVDIVTDDRNGRISDPFIDPTDTFRLIRFTARITSSGGVVRMVPGTSRLLPFRYDQKYEDDETAHGHNIAD